MDELEAMVREAFEDEQPCTVPLHDFSGLHSGPGEWYVSTRCPVCGEGAVDLMCNRYFVFVQVNMSMWVPCVCGVEVKMKDLIVGIEPKEEKEND
jgi:hypothetical protein